MFVLRFLGKNFGSLLLAFSLAMLAWFSAVTAADPNLEQDYPRSINISFEGQNPNLLLTEKSQSQVHLSIKAPRSVWDNLLSDETLIRVWVDLSDLPAGEHIVDVHIEINDRPARTLSVTPDKIQIKLENLQTETIPIKLVMEGKQASAYTAKQTVLEPAEVTISGAESQVSQVTEVRARVNLTNATTDIHTTLPLIAYDANGNAIDDIVISPPSATVTVSIQLLGGYSNVVVKVKTVGQVADGYKLTGILITPPNVVVFSADPAKIDQLPGYIETDPLDLTGAQDDFEAWVELKLNDEDISVVGDSQVLVQVSIAAIESTISFDLSMETVGLPPELNVEVSPTTIDVLVSGPVPVLKSLVPSDVRAVIDLTDYEPGTYNLIPEIGPLPERVAVLSLQPASVAVNITIAPTATPLPTITITPRVTSTPNRQ